MAFMRTCRALWFGALVSLSAGAAPAAGIEDRHAGYYYPPPETREVYKARSRTIETADRKMRLGFVVALTQEQFARPHPPNYAVFAKGDEADKLILMSMGQSGFQTLYQARGLLAQLTAVARNSPMFQEMGVEDLFTFFDLIRLVGFRQITVTDGRAFAHQVVLE